MGHLITTLDTTTPLYTSTRNTYFTTIIMKAQFIALFMLLAVFSLGMGKPHQEQRGQNNMHDKRAQNEHSSPKTGGQNGHNKRGMFEDENNIQNKRGRKMIPADMAKRGMMDDEEKREMMGKMQRRNIGAGKNHGGQHEKRSLGGSEESNMVMQKRNERCDPACGRNESCVDGVCVSGGLSNGGRRPSPT